MKCISKHPTIEQNLCRRGALRSEGKQSRAAPHATPICRARLLPSPAAALTNCVPSQEREGRRGSLQQLIAAARLPNSGICEIAVNASLAFIEGAKPRDEIECALVIQMACTHSAAMAVLNRLGGAAGDRTVAGMASAAARLLRAYATPVEALRRLRNGVLKQSASSMCM